LYQNKEEGGLGIKDINMFNTTLLSKWKWRLGKKIGLWKDILEVWILKKSKWYPKL